MRLHWCFLAVSIQYFKNEKQRFYLTLFVLQAHVSLKKLVQNITNLAPCRYNVNVPIFKDQGYTKTVCNFDLYTTVEFQVELQAFSSPLYFSYPPVLSVELQVQGCVVGKTRAIMWEAQGKDTSGWNTCSIGYTSDFPT